MTTTPTISHTVDDLVTHDRVLDLVVRSLRDPKLKGEVKDALDSARSLALSEVSYELHRCAVLTISGLARWNPIFEPATSSADQRRFEEVAKAWMLWANNSKPEVPEETKSQATGGGMNLMAYNLWACAVRSLVSGEVHDAERFYRRVLDLGTQYEITHFREIKWSYAASFFHSGLTSED
jgi:hypothetical protein